ncbi:MAG: hypothetical protein AVDCRST_MAG59-3117, partial [uncultured Thermomicrobiales bacterium]
ARPPFGPHAETIEAGAAPVDRRLVAQPVQQLRVQPLPDPGLLPIPEPPPAGRPAAAAELHREQPPRAAGAQDEDDAGEGGAVGDAGRAALRLRRLRRQQRLDGFPKGVGNKPGAHDEEASCHPSGGFATRSKLV